MQSTLQNSQFLILLLSMKESRKHFYFLVAKTELGKMPHRHSPKTLRRYSMLALAKHWDLICYAAHSTREMNALLESDGYLKFEGPFCDMRKPVHNTACRQILIRLKNEMLMNLKF